MANTNPVMLALSTQWQSAAAVKAAMRQGEKKGEMVIIFVVDVAVAHRIAVQEVGVISCLEREYAEALLAEYERLAGRRLNAILRLARQRGVRARGWVRSGGFVAECLKAADELKPSLIVTARSRRSAWVRRLFGSPLDYLIANAECEVIEA